MAFSTHDRGPQGAQDDKAPTYSVPTRPLQAIEHPMLVMNVDKALESFGKLTLPQHFLDQKRTRIPLYLHPEDPLSRPIQSHKASSHNVVLKITVPKRTGRKRKRGSDGPFEGDVGMDDAKEGQWSADPEVSSRSRLDDPLLLQRKLRDNIGRYEVQPVGVIRTTHRYRGLAGYDWDTTSSAFAREFADKVLSGNVSKMKQFKLPIEQSESPHFDIVPPPEYTHITVPFQYNYSHNVYSSTPAESRDGPARELAPTAVSSSHSSSASSPATSDEDYTSRRRRRGRRLSATGWDDKGWGHLIRYDEFPAPTGPKPEALAFFDAPRQRSQQLRREVQATIEALRKILEERPIWTRRGIINRLLEREAATARTVSAGGPHTSARHGPLDPGAAPGGRPGDREARLWGLVKLASRYVAYQFISGPFRDAIVKFGVDPRTDPKYRVYQTLCFKFRFSRDGGGASSLPEDDGVGGGQQSWREFNRAHTSLLERGEQVWMGDYNDRSGGDAAGGADGSNNHFNSHIFDGRRFSASSKLWQVCDVTDPVLAGLFESAAVRPASAPDLAVAGWYTRPLWAHAKAIMKTRIVAIQFGLAATQAPDWAFAAVVESARQWDRKAMDAILAAVHDAGGERVGGNDGYAATATPSGASHGTRPSAPPIGDAGWPGHVTGLPALNLTPAQQAELSGRSTVRRRHGGDGGGGGGDGDGGGNGRPPAAVAARKWRAVGSNKRSRPLETVSMAGLFAPTGASDAAASDTTAAFRAAKGVRTAGEGKGKEVAAEPDTAGPAVGASSGEARQLATRQVRFASLDDADEIMEEDMEDEPDEAASGGDSTSDYDEEEMESEIARFGRRGHDFGDEEDVDEEDNENEDNMDSSDEKTPAGYPLQDDMSDVDEDYDE